MLAAKPAVSVRPAIPVAIVLLGALAFGGARAVRAGNPEDFGDAPATYGTTLAGNGARHAVDSQSPSPLRMGSCVDTEPDAASPLDGGGDDFAAGTSFGSCGGLRGDEDGVSLSGDTYAACQPNGVSITASAAGMLDAWFDWNRDGDFVDPGEAIATGMPLVVGPNSLTFTVPCTAVHGQTYSRFRLSSAGGLAPTGAAADGEVEDHAVFLTEVDFGDAPDSYGTSFAAGGPTHPFSNVSTLYLGSCVDAEDDARTPLDGVGDDGAPGDLVAGVCATPGDDDDGVTIPPLVACENATLQVVAHATGTLDAWIDWNRDGDFLDFGEVVAAGLTVPAGTNPLIVNVPCGASLGTSYARFRLSTVGVLGPGGPTPGGGEVEDYEVQLIGGTIMVPTLDGAGLALLAALVALAGAALLARQRRRSIS